MNPIAVFTVWALASSAFAAQFVTNQNASVVLGQPNFTESGPASGYPNRLYFPAGVACDAATGKVYIADSENHRVLRFSSAAAARNGGNPEMVFGQENFTGSLANQGGSANGRTLSSPAGLQVDAKGTLWIADRGNNRILGFYFASSRSSNSPAADFVLGQLDFVGTSSGITASKLNFPTAISVGPDGTLWIADTGNSRVLRFANAPLSPFGYPADGVLGQSNFVSNTGATGINRMNFPHSVHADAAGRLWVSDQGNFRVLRFDSAATKATPTGGNADGVLGQTDFSANSSGLSAAKFASAGGLVLDASGTLWLSDSSNRRIVGFQNAASLGNGGAATIVLGQANLVSSTIQSPSAKSMAGASALATGPGGSLLAVDSDFSRVLRFDPISAPGLVLNTKNTTTQKPTYLVKGKATGSVTSVSYRVGKTGAFKQASGTSSWKFTASLKPDKNDIFIYATGPGGQSATRKITITRN